jgi:DDE family transposase
VTADGAGVVSHAGSRLLADLADATTLTGELSEALNGVRGPRPRHDPGRVLVDLAVAIADGAETICDIAVLADQPALFGSVASDSTCWRLLAALDERALAEAAAARARAGVPLRSRRHRAPARRTVRARSTPPAHHSYWSTDAHACRRPSRCRRVRAENHVTPAVDVAPSSRA